MGDQNDDNQIFWCNPIVRAVIPISKLHISRKLKKLCRKNKFEFSINHDFSTTISNCANREETWINKSIISTYSALHDLGYAHSIEVWEDKKLKGGLYGVAIGKVFFAESMFSLSSPLRAAPKSKTISFNCSSLSFFIKSLLVKPNNK